MIITILKPFLIHHQQVQTQQNSMWQTNLDKRAKENRKDDQC